MLLLVPRDVLHPRRPDAHFADEAGAARAAGLEVALVDHDALCREDGARQAVARIPASDTPRRAVYRGWMLRGERYAAFAAALADRCGVTLTTGPEQYRRAHELPGWYGALAGLTPSAVWTHGDDRDGFVRACGDLGPGPAVLRDYTKSMKHYWNEAVFIPDAGDPTGAWAVASRFRELRGDDFVGGFVLRRFERLDPAEVRTWWVAGTCRLVGAHPDTPDDLPPPDFDPAPVAPAVAALGLPFVTVDLARRDDGTWRIIELGDGQVSDRPASLPAHDLITAVTAVTG